MYFETKLSNSVKTITILSFLFFLGIAFYITRLTIWLGLEGIPILVFCLTVMISILVWVSRYRISGCQLISHELSFHSWGKRYSAIHLDSVESMQPITIPFQKCVRLWGNGGIWGFYGEFKQVGRPYFTAYVTDTKHCVLVKMKGGGLIVISPYERERFLEVLVTLRPDLSIKTSPVPLGEVAKP